MKERDEAKEKAHIAHLVYVIVGDTKARVEDDLARVRGTLAVEEEAKHRAEAKITHREVDQTSLLLELGVVKDEVSSLQFQAGKDKESME